MKDLCGKVAIVTGSTSGIGQSVVELLAKHGVKVTVTGRDQKRGESVVASITEGGGDALFVPADLIHLGATKTLVDNTIERWGKLDIVVNNAALVYNKPIEEVNDEDWDRLFQVNVKSAFFLIQAALPWLKESKGSVVNVSSINRIINDRNNFVYDSMKAALNHMSRGLSLDLRQDGIRVNVVMPGGVATPMLKDWLIKKNCNPEEIEPIYEAMVSDPAVASPEQVAKAIVFLASSQAEWINGAEIPLEGGYSIGQG